MTLKSTQTMDATVRNAQLSRPGSLRDDPLRPLGEKTLRRARTIAGTSTSSSLPQATPVAGLSILSEINTNVRERSYSPYTRTKQRENVSEAYFQDENLGIKTSGKQSLDQANQSKNKSIPGLYPRLSLEGKTFPETRVHSIRNQNTFHELQNEPDEEQPSNRSFVTLLSKNFNGLSTIKNSHYSDGDNENYEPPLGRKFTNVELNVPQIKLLEDSAPLDLSLVKRRLVPYASPFFQTIEFNPCEPTDTGILLKILNHEFESLDDENEDEMLQEKENKRTPWYRGLLDLEKCYTRFVNSFKPLTKEEYNTRYPWDKFYDPELYYDNEMDDEGVLNTELLPENLHNSISLEINDSMKPYSYVSRRKGY